MLRQQTAKILVGLGALSLSLAACGGSSVTSLNTTKVSETIKSQSGASDVSVTCPPDIPLQSGLVTACEATIDGTVNRVEITQTDASGDVNIKWEDANLFNTPDFEAKLAGIVTDALGSPVAVECPEDTPLEAGRVTECIAYDDEYEVVVLLTQKDAMGNFDWQFVE